MRDLQKFPATGGRNSLWQWSKARNPLRTAINFLIIQLCKYLPSLSLKNFFYRLMGMKVGKNAAVALAVQFDIFFPELIEIGENAIIGYGTTVLAHEYLQKEWRKGRVKIGKNALIGACSLIMPGVEIGDNATVSALSLVNKDIPANAFYGGVPAKPIKTKKQG